MSWGRVLQIGRGSVRANGSSLLSASRSFLGRPTKRKRRFNRCTRKKKKTPTIHGVTTQKFLRDTTLKTENSSYKDQQCLVPKKLFSMFLFNSSPSKGVKSVWRSRDTELKGIALGNCALDYGRAYFLRPIF